MLRVHGAKQQSGMAKGGIHSNSGSVAEWSACCTRNPAVPGSSPALATEFVLSLPEFKSLARLVNSQLAASCQLGF